MGTKRRFSETFVVKVIKQQTLCTAVGIGALFLLIAACGSNSASSSVSGTITDAAPPDHVPEQPGGSFASATWFLSK